jgi:hypothetical protein
MEFKMNTFNPVKYSAEENAFLLENAGKSPIVALNKGVPQGVNASAIRPALQEFYDREMLSTVEQVEWVGLDAIKDSIRKWLENDAKWEADWKRTRGRIPRYPSMYTQDGKGRFHLAGPGSDSDYPKTWLDANGGRHRFEVNLDGYIDDSEGDVMPAAPKDIIHDIDKNRYECPICSHTESYRDDSKASGNAARARMATHLKRSTKEVSLHRELYTNVFGA